MDLVERLVTAVQEGEDERAAALAEEVLKEFQECYDIRKAPSPRNISTSISG